ncbi:MAG: ATP-binding protein [Bacteroidetes bacterium]|nr:ATP-binding protein [Bacteroidota bacterium]
MPTLHPTSERAPIRRSVSNQNESVSSESVSSETLSDFSQVVTHRIGSLLSSIEGYTDLIMAKLDSKEDRENAFRILESVSRVGGILADVKHYQESFSLNKEIKNIRKLMAEVLGLLADSEADRLIFECRIPDGVSAVIDQTKIKQALLSVLRNAFEATAPNKLPVSLFVDAFPGTSVVQFRIYSPIPIADQSTRRQLFNPFFTTKATNLGLGLTMARRVFREHGGDVLYTSSEIDAGTEFTCTLDLSSK